MSDQRLLGSAAAAKYLDMSTRTLSRRRNSGLIAAKCDGGTVKYDVRELDRYAESLDDYEPAGSR
jgi:hypothetical protein